jgi:uncharacterized protein (TIGR00156 family)
MKYSISVIALCGFAVAANADSNDGGFKGPDNFKLVTVAQALQLSDDAEVRMEGFIVKAVGDEKYEFRDDSGTMLVEIDDDDWRGLEVTPDVRVRIHGEIDKEWRDTQLDADGIQTAE